MSKIKTTLTIEQKVFEKAKKHIPNISEFVEECLKQYVGLADGIYPTSNAQEIIDKIGRLQAELFILNKNFDFKESMQKAEEEKLNVIWLGIWNTYRAHTTIPKQELKTASEYLKVNEEILEDILDFTYVNQEEFGNNLSWKEIYGKYNEEGGE